MKTKKKVTALAKVSPKNVPAINASALVDPQALISQAISAGTNVDSMERLMSMRRELRAEWAKGQYFKAMSSFQKVCPVITKKNRVFEKESTRVRYKYASLDDIISQVRELLESFGFSYRFETKQDKSDVTAICISYHKDGHSETTSFTVPIDPKAFMSEPQKYASALTFAKRYTFCNSFGIATGDEDTDANDKSDIPSRQDAIFQLIKPMLEGHPEWSSKPTQWYKRTVANLLGPGKSLTSHAALDQYEEALKAGRFDVDTAELIK
jgi:hypothetical protein